MPQPHATTLTSAANHRPSYSQSQSSYRGAYGITSTHSNYNKPPSTANLPSSISRFPPAGPLVGGFAPVAGRGRGTADRSASESGPSTFSSRAPAYYYHYNHKGRGGSVGAAGPGVGAGAPDLVADYQQNQGSRNLRGLNLNLGDGETLTQPPPIPGDNDEPASPSFAAGSLPRSSSLLPPPRILANAQAFHADQEPVSFLEPLTPRELQTFHQRTGSTGGASDGFRNLNRWSASTTSSPGDRDWVGIDYQEPQQQPAPLPKPTTNFSRRMSVDSVALLTQSDHSSPPAHQSPRRLTKRRASEASGSASPVGQTRAASSASGRTRSNSRATSPPNLPSIVALPSLQLPGLTGSPPTALSRLSPSAVITPNSVFANQAKDYSLWDEIADPNSSSISPGAPRGRTAVQTSPAPVDANKDHGGEREGSDMPDKKGHTRSRSSAAKGSSDSTKTRHGKQPSQKAMLSRALAKANTAVQLDNAQNYEGARESYIEACDLLQQVLGRTTGEEDKKKLDAIKRTYTSRIEELDGMVPVQIHRSKALPARPESVEYNGVLVERADEDDLDDTVVIETATTTRIAASPNGNRQRAWPPTLTDARYEPPKSAMNSAMTEPQHSALQSAFTKSPMRRNFEGKLNIPQNNDVNQLLPAPLSPRRPVTPAKPASPETVVRQNFSMNNQRLAPAPEIGRGHSRNPSTESVSFFLDPIEESGGSATTSVHSRSSSFGVRRKHIRAASGGTEAEFDAALDAAVEAAYDDGYEPMDSFELGYDDENEDTVVANAMRKVELAKERVRERERDAAIELARERERQRLMENSHDAQTFGEPYVGNDSDEEEERMLEEMTRGYVMDDFPFGQLSEPQSNHMPRESDSSGVTQRTWQSSTGSNPPTSTTVLSTVTEMSPAPSKTPPPPSLPPPQALPRLPPQPPGVRSRRLSGQNAKQLKIETSKIGPPPATLPPGVTSAMQPKQSGSYIAQQRQALSATTARPGPFSMRVPSSPGRGISPAPAAAPPTSPHQQSITEESEDATTGSPSSIRAGIRKKQSSSSLKSLRTRQQSVSKIDIDNVSDLSPNTPLSTSTLTNNPPIPRQPAMPTLPTPMAAHFREKISGFGGLYLFDDLDSPAPHSPTSTHSSNPDAPLPLEPCPSDVMLRPFWLMRALYQTLSHPRGGYITNKLFVPRDVWKVKGVKLRNLEDKSSQCDLLTAALLKLARVDSTDADAVLEEMQSLENVLEQVQITLTRKLGNEVGTQGLSRDENELERPVMRNASVSNKAGAFSWRRLRSKGSAVNLGSAYGAKSNSGSGAAASTFDLSGADRAASLASLPMVANAINKTAKRDISTVKFDGPFAGYMASLARLFDAAQTLGMFFSFPFLRQSPSIYLARRSVRLSLLSSSCP
ncbi:uncharacterized protein BCR38DRAFT_117769 [Pseudomassariella vexata]|uniref:MIT domain-containing protein n=1 Tax=Pseudomassariella vexata TaxID=1141098 RepID=A0A1Y2DCF6_9PEZI|nr:uncharacterized protein BCR38DRAFT_117769 [Pseudomassariella vexata]ORY56355.1 hypothetical protein BCR38DRAFT_117769 [Pseudomassariella vexata]